MSCPGFLPPFQAQNPAISGDRYGWEDCTAFSAAMALGFDTCGSKKATGGTIRALSSEPVPDPNSPGLNLGQVDDVLRNHFGVDLEVRTRYSWDDFARRIDGGAAAILQVQYEPIRASRFAGSKTFGKGHAILVPPGWGVMDPLADGRRPGIYKYHGEPYPKTLLRAAAGALEVAIPRTGLRPIGAGLVFAAFTRDNAPSYEAVMAPGLVDWWKVIAGKASRQFLQRKTGGFHLKCSAPRQVEWLGHGRNGKPARVSLVRIMQPGASYHGRYLALHSPRLTLKEIP